MKWQHYFLLFVLLAIYAVLFALSNLILSLVLPIRSLRFSLLGLVTLWLIFKIRKSMLFVGSTNTGKQILEREYGQYLAATYVTHLDNLEKVALCVLEKEGQVEDLLAREEFEEIRVTLSVLREVHKKMETKGLLKGGSPHEKFSLGVNNLIKELKSTSLTAEKLNITCSFWAILGEWSIVYSKTSLGSFISN